MDRRRFVKLTSGALGMTTAVNVFPMSLVTTATGRTFPLHFAPHPGMFAHHAGDDLVSQISFMAEAGFTAFEDNDMRLRDVQVQNTLANALGRHEMQMGVFVGHKIYWDRPHLTSGDPDLRTAFLMDIEASVEVARRVRARWMTVVPGHVDLRVPDDYQTANVVEALRRAAEILEPHDLVMVLEPLNSRDHPGQFLQTVAQAWNICKAVDSPACKILFDVYHQQIQAGDLITNMERAWDEIAYFQIGDVPGRNEPTTGEINYRNIFKYIASRGYTGILGMEHGNSLPGKEGEVAIIDAYSKTTDFE